MESYDNMSIKQRRYKLHADFEKVYRFLQETYDPITLNSYLLPQFFEYAHTHPLFDHKLTHRFGLWEDNGVLCGVACYEMKMGEAFLSVKPGYDMLLPELLDWAKNELSLVEDGEKELAVWVTDKEIAKQALLEKDGFQCVHSHAVTTFSYDKPFLDSKLPEGFSLIALSDENNPSKIHDCLWKGFEHDGPPDNNPDWALQMQSGSRFAPELTTIVKAPDGEYACLAGMWFDEQNTYAYLEPLATVPEYRRMGLATIALMESMKRTKLLGATYCFGGVGEFYTAIGFKLVCNRELWEKEW